jgi:hypothetical protein
VNNDLRFEIGIHQHVFLLSRHILGAGVGLLSVCKSNPSKLAHVCAAAKPRLVNAKMKAAALSTTAAQKVYQELESLLSRHRAKKPGVSASL